MSIATQPLTPDQYFAIDAVSNSMLKAFDQSPSRAYQQYVARTMETEPTAKMLIGSVSHLVLLEPHRIETQIALIPNSVLAKNGAKSTSDFRDWATEHPDQYHVKADELVRVNAIVAAIRRHPEARVMLDEPGECEHVVQWECPATDLACKALLDKRQAHRGIIWDVKTTTVANPQTFVRQIENLGYYRQAAWYVDGHREAYGTEPRFWFIAVETKPPFDVSVCGCDPDWIEAGRKENAATIERIARCLESGKWEANWQSGVITLKRPGYWKFKKDYDLESEE